MSPSDVESSSVVTPSGSLASASALLVLSTLPDLPHAMQSNNTNATRDVARRKLNTEAVFVLDSEAETRERSHDLRSHGVHLRIQPEYAVEFRSAA
jgi:hypothetical protein